jgi:hypothetical protein
MTLKSAYFAFTGKRLQDPITWPGDLRPAIDLARNNTIIWPHQGAGHNILAWAEWLIQTRINQNQRYLSIEFEQELRTKAQQAYQLWRETLRYHPNTAYLFEVRKMRNSAEWFLINSSSL